MAAGVGFEIGQSNYVVYSFIWRRARVPLCPRSAKNINLVAVIAWIFALWFAWHIDLAKLAND
jgi:hypothetical protein